MNILVDNQLPVALARYLAAQGHDCQHVADVGLQAEEDQVIWQYAKERGLAIISKDEDFQILSKRQGSIPPQVVWVRLGNCRKVALLEAFTKILPQLDELLASGEAVIEIR